MEQKLFLQEILQSFSKDENCYKNIIDTILDNYTDSQEEKDMINGIVKIIDLDNKMTEKLKSFTLNDTREDLCIIDDIDILMKEKNDIISNLPDDMRLPDNINLEYAQ
jgi:hypothetical protein